MTARFTGYGPSGKRFDVTITMRRAFEVTRRDARASFERAIAGAASTWERMGHTGIKRVRPKRAARRGINV